MKDKVSSDFEPKSDGYLSHTSRALSTPYDDYDKRPIKPLNENILQKQLLEYHEPTEEELNKIRQK